MRNPFKSNVFASERNFLIALSLLWLLMQVALHKQFGLVTQDEAAKYIREAGLLVDGQPYTKIQYLLYSTYILFLSFCLKIKIGLYGAFVLQTALSGLSMYYFYKLACLLSGNQTQSKIATLYLVCCFPYQAWNTYLYTESFFLSLTIFFLYCFFKKGLKNAGTLFLMAAVLFARPTGIIAVSAVLLFALFRYVKDKKLNPVSMLIGATVVTALFLLTNRFLSIGGSFDFARPFLEGHVICDVPTKELSGVDPAAIRNANSIQGMIQLFFHSPGFFLELFYKRTISFFGFVRSYYSTGHNAILMALFYPLYLAVIVSMVQMLRRRAKLALFFLLFTGFFYLSVIMSCDDWLNRFVMPVIPVLVLAAACIRFKKEDLPH
jgi:hypothetical protein